MIPELCQSRNRNLRNIAFPWTVRAKKTISAFLDLSRWSTEKVMPERPAAQSLSGVSTLYRR
jgi:hypothetical protein